MKKLLLATSALTLMAGAASAEIALSGSARMGLTYDGTDTLFSSRVRIVFTASGETDTGLSFGASVRNDQSGQGGTANGDSTVFISGAFGKLTMGDAGNAPDALVGQVSGVGYGPNDAEQEIDFLTTTKTGVLYEYSTGAFTFALGSAQLNAAAGGDTTSIAVKYAGSSFSIALGYEDNATADQISAKGTATFGGATVALKLVDRSTAADMAAALSVDYTTGATTLTAFATNNDDFDGLDAYGLGAAYDLGGGAAVKAGVIDNGVDTIGDIGLTFSF